MKFISNKVKSECIHSVALVLAAVAVCVLLSFPVSALVKTASASPRSGGETSGLVTGDQYCSRTFASLEEADSYFHWESYERLSRPIVRYGISYNYYYEFSDGSRVYFSVAE